MKTVNVHGDLLTLLEPFQSLIGAWCILFLGAYVLHLIASNS